MVVSYRNSTSNHNRRGGGLAKGLLYLIEILHQTTTTSQVLLLQLSCILSKFYIKPQLTSKTGSLKRCCILSKFYIKPQQVSKVVSRNRGCILSKFYIKPQPVESAKIVCVVVSYRNSTSNHNGSVDLLPGRPVVSYRNSTSNHNSGVGVNATMSLYLIEILHQTTTLRRSPLHEHLLYLIEILHQTTTLLVASSLAVWLYLIEILHQTTTNPVG